MSRTFTDFRLVESPSRDAGNVTVTPLEAQRLACVKAAFTTRRVPVGRLRTLLEGELPLRAGDLVLARVDRVRQHTRIERTDGRRAHLHAGDEIMVCLGNRYAPDQFHAVVPDRLGPCHLVAAGGIAARVLDRHAAMKPATEITVLGVVGDAKGRPLNLARFALPRPGAPAHRPVITAVVGTSMNSGKTTTAAHLVRGLSLAQRRVGSAKITGTGSGGDLWRALDAGAALALDFTDAGHASTYCLRTLEIEQILDTLVAGLTEAGVDSAVIEIADGMMHVETARLIASAHFAQRVDHVLFAAGDAMGAVAGARQLRELGLPLRLVSGALTRSPLATREAGSMLDVPVVPVERLAEPSFALAATQFREAAAGGFAAA